MGRPPIGKQAMSDAERQRRHRAKFRDSRPVTKSDRPAAAEIAALKKELAQAKTRVLKLQNEVARQERTNVALIVANRQLRSRKAILSKAQFNHICACLHPGSRANFTDAALTRARMAFESLEKVLVKDAAK